MYEYIINVMQNVRQGIRFDPAKHVKIGKCIRTLQLQLGAYAPGTAVPLLKTLSFPLVAGNDDYRSLGLAVDVSLVPQENMVKMNVPAACEKWKRVLGHEVYQENFPQGEKGTGEILQMTIQTVSAVLDRTFSAWECELMQANIGHSEWSVAAMILGLNCLESSLRSAIIAARWHHIPLRLWKDDLKTILQALRRCPRVFGAVATEADVFMLRKLPNCSYRSKDEPDWQEEKRNRTEEFSVHYYAEGDRVFRDKWKDELAATAQLLTHSIVASMAQAPNLDSVEEWWSARWGWAPQGSTTLRHKLKDYGVEDERLPANARPGKKTAWEALDSNYARNAMYVQPAKVARASTKPEPGGKQRSLYACDDPHTIVAAYASVHVEKFMNVWGMKGKQTPADVADWLVASYLTKKPNVWVSLDYSDFNTEHELWALMQLDFAFGESWKQSGLGVASEKMRACVWTAMAHANAWVQEASGEYYRCMGTLFSGDRNTARDNTCLHAVYSRVCSKIATGYDPDGSILKSNYTGDDEDLQLSDWVHAWFYTQSHALAGFVLKPAKQMVDVECHEFLQRNTAPGALTIRPLFAALAQRASGNWYQDVYLWYDNITAAMSANCWELHTRGMPIIYARRLAAIMINAMMRVPDVSEPDGWRRLDWWPYRHGVGTAPLWYGLPGPLRPQPSIDAKPKPHVDLPTKATDAWIARRMDRCSLVLSDSQHAEYREYCMKEAYGKLYVRERADIHREYALRQWPKRDASGTIPWYSFSNPLPEPVAAEHVIRWMLMGPGDRRPATMDEVLSRLELDAKFVEIAGGLERVLPKLKHHVLAKFEWPMSRGETPISWQYHDAAIAAWLSTTAVVHRLYKEDVKYVWIKNVALPAIRNAQNAAHELASESLHTQHHAPPVIFMYVAPNAAGKSTFVKSRSDAFDMDEVVDYTGMRTSNRMTMAIRSQLASYPLAERMENVVLAMQRNIMTTQYDITDMLRPHSERTFAVQLVIVDPPQGTLITRMMARGWPEDKIQRRLQRWQTIKDGYINNKSLILSPTEKQSLVIVQSF